MRCRLRGLSLTLTSSATPPNTKFSRQLHSNAKVQRNYYDSLGLTPKASQSDIKQAYYTLSLKYHPDKSHGESEKFREITAAYEVLGNFKLRRLYDRGALHLGHAPHPSEATPESVHKNTPNFEARPRRQPMTGRTMQFNFDDWSKAHYGRLFDREEEKRRKLASRRGLEQFTTNQGNVGGVVLLLVFIIMAVSCSFLEVSSSSSHYDYPKKHSHDSKR